MAELDSWHYWDGPVFGVLRTDDGEFLFEALEPWESVDERRYLLRPLGDGETITESELKRRGGEPFAEERASIVRGLYQALNGQAGRRDDLLADDA